MVMVDIKRALEIDGWMTPTELQWLAEQAQTHKIIVEIGSYLGRSTRALADHAPGAVYAVDDWLGPRDVSIPTEERAKLFNRFLTNMAGLEGKLSVVRTNHDRVGEIAKPDMVFIDGDHTYLNARRDIKFWWDKLLCGGLLCGHDSELPSVRQAAKDILGDYEVAPDTTIWFKTKHTY